MRLRELAKRIAHLESLPPVAPDVSSAEPPQTHPLVSEMAQRLVDQSAGFPVDAKGLRERIRADGLSDDPVVAVMARVLIDGGAMPTGAAPLPVAVADERDDQIAALRERIEELRGDGNRPPNGLKEL